MVRHELQRAFQAPNKVVELSVELDACLGRTLVARHDDIDAGTRSLLLQGHGRHRQLCETPNESPAQFLWDCHSRDWNTSYRIVKDVLLLKDGLRDFCGEVVARCHCGSSLVVSLAACDSAASYSKGAVNGSCLRE